MSIFRWCIFGICLACIFDHKLRNCIYQEFNFRFFVSLINDLVFDIEYQNGALLLWAYSALNGRFLAGLF